MYTSEQIAEIASNRIDFVDLFAQVKRKADIAEKVASSGAEFLGALASAHGEFDSIQTFEREAAVGAKPITEVQTCNAERYRLAAEALAPMAVSQHEADNKRQ